MGQTFTISPSDYITPVRSPDGLFSAFVVDPEELIIQDKSGAQQKVYSVMQITSLAWHTDNIHLIYSKRSSTSKPPNPLAIWDELWVLNTLTGQQRQLSQVEENLHHPLVSPGGQYLALSSGTGFIDACLVDDSLVIMQLDSSLERVKVFDLSDFSGIIIENEVSGMISSIYVIGEPIWRLDHVFEVELQWTCTTDPPNGRYQLDLNSLTAINLDN
jgi:hypothetical protein